MKLKRSGTSGMIVVAMIVMLLALPLPAFAQQFNTYAGTLTVNGGNLDTTGTNVRVSVEGWPAPQEATAVGNAYGMTVQGEGSDVGKTLNFEVKIEGMGWVKADPICIACQGASAEFVNTAALQEINLVAPSGMPTINFSSAAYQVSEGNSLMVYVNLSEPGSETVTVDYMTVDIGDATEGTDYTAAADTLTFNPGETSKSFMVATTEDTEWEQPDEVFHVQLANANNGIIGAPNPVPVTILDDGDPMPPKPHVRFAQGTFEGPEGSTVMVEVELSEASDETVTVEYLTVDTGDANDPADYLGGGDVLTFVPGDTSEFIDIDLLNDALFEGPETFNVILQNPNEEAIIGSPSTAVVTITDTDDPNVEWWCHAKEVALIAPFPGNDRPQLGTPVNIDDIKYDGEWFQIFKYDEKGTVGGCDWLTYVSGFANDGPCSLTQLVPGEYYYVVVSDETKPLQW